MNTDQIFIFTGRAVRDIVESKFLHGVTLVTITLSVLIVGAFSLFLINANDMMNTWQKGFRIIAYLKPDAQEAQVQELTRYLKTLDGVQRIAFIPRDTALQNLRDQMKHQASFFENLKENPLPDAFEIHVEASRWKGGEIANLAAQIESLTDIDDVEYGQQWVKRFIAIVNLFTCTGFALSALFFIVTVSIIANTIRLALFSRRKEIEIMRLVGATDAFIKAPFYIEALLQGALGGAAGLGILLVAFGIISTNIGQDLSISMIEVRFLSPELSCGIILCSTLVGWLGCFLSLRQFLKI